MLDAGKEKAVSSPQLAKPVAPRERELLSRRRRILIVDDDVMICMVTGEMLKWLGYEPSFATDGKAAIEVYMKARDEENPFDAVILDLVAGKGPGGRETLLEILKLDPDVKAIVSSGHSESQVLTAFREYGFKGALTKPYTAEMLDEVLRQALDSSSSTAGT